MLKHAFKEWAVVCRALAEGRQAIILRKGGIAEAGGEFQMEHNRFWLYPTYVHQQRDGIKAEALPLLEQAEADRPTPGTIRLTHFAEVPGVYQVHELVPALMLAHLHIWSEDTVRKRLNVFHRQTEPLVEYYEERGLLRRFDGTRSPTEVHDHIRAVLATLRLEEQL